VASSLKKKKTVKLTVKTVISPRDAGIRTLQQEYVNYKKSLIPKVQQALRQVIKDRNIKVYTQQKWMLDQKIARYIKNLPLHPMPFHNQSVWIEDREGYFFIHLKTKQEEGEATCYLKVPSRYHNIIKKACGKNNPVLGQVELIEDNKFGYFNVHIVLRLPKPEPYTPKAWVGVDIGFNCLAVSAVVTTHEITDVTFHCKEFKTRIIQLKYLLKQYQRSNRSWKKWNSRLQHVTENTVKQIAKNITAKAKKHKAGVVMENLTFRSHTKQWFIPRYKLKRIIQTLCERKGIPFKLINPRNTSITCNKCGATSKASRNGKNFKCKTCGYACNADYNAAVNIAKKAILPTATRFGLKSKGLHALEMGEIPTPSVAIRDLKPPMSTVKMCEEVNTETIRMKVGKQM